MRFVPAVLVLVLLASAVAVGVGAALIYVPAGFIVAGFEGAAAAYAGLYVWARHGRS